MPTSTASTKREELRLILRRWSPDDRIIVVSINGRIYNYLVPDGDFDEVVRRVQFFLRKGWPGKALAHLKKTAWVYNPTQGAGT